VFNTNIYSLYIIKQVDLWESVILYHTLLHLLGKVNNVCSSNKNSSNCSSRNNNNYGGALDVSRNGLGGLFAGGMPKLKPTGRGYSKYLQIFLCVIVKQNIYSVRSCYSELHHTSFIYMKHLS
jgi:hypothetical protein